MPDDFAILTDSQLQAWNDELMQFLKDITPRLTEVMEKAYEIEKTRKINPVHDLTTTWILGTILEREFSTKVSEVSLRVAVQNRKKARKEKEDAAKTSA